MRTHMLFAPGVAAALALATLSMPALAATAHNSQAGALGPSKNSCGATAYFAADSGCLSSYIEGKQDDGLPLPNEQRARYRPRSPLQ